VILGFTIVGLGSLFKGVGGFFELLSKMVEEGKEEASQTRQVEALGGKLKGVYGFTVKVGLGGKPIVEKFGNIQETETGPRVSESREPMIDILDEGGHLLVIAELPGVESKDIHISLEGDVLEINASSGNRSYRKEALLPFTPDPQSLEHTYRNGVLEIKLKKKE
jgi:HSP20 family protein